MSEPKTNIEKCVRLQYIINSLQKSECNEKDLDVTQQNGEKRFKLDTDESVANLYRKTIFEENVSVRKHNESKDNAHDLDSSGEIVRKPFTCSTKRPNKFKHTTFKSNNKRIKDYFHVTKGIHTFITNRNKDKDSNCQHLSTKRKWDSSSDDDIPDLVKPVENDNFSSKNRLLELMKDISFHTPQNKNSINNNEYFTTSRSNSSTINHTSNGYKSQEKNNFLIDESNTVKSIMADMKMYHILKGNDLKKCKDNEMNENYRKTLQATYTINSLDNRADSIFFKVDPENNANQQSQTFGEHQEVATILKELKQNKQNAILKTPSSSKIRIKCNSISGINVNNSNKENEESFYKVDNIKKSKSKLISNDYQTKKQTKDIDKKSHLIDFKESISSVEENAKLRKNDIKDPKNRVRHNLDSFIMILTETGYQNRKVANCQNVDNQSQFDRRQKLGKGKEVHKTPTTNVQTTTTEDKNVSTKNNRTSIINDFQPDNSKKATNSFKNLLENLLQRNKVTDLIKKSSVASTESEPLPIKPNISHYTNYYEENIKDNKIVNKPSIIASSTIEQTSDNNGNESEHSFVFQFSNPLIETNSQANLRQSQIEQIDQLSVTTITPEIVNPNAIVVCNDNMTSDYGTWNSQIEARNLKNLRNENLTNTQSYLKVLLESKKGMNTNEITKNQKYEDELDNTQQLSTLQSQTLTREINVPRDEIEEILLTDEKLYLLLSKNYEKFMKREKARTVNRTTEFNNILDRIIAKKNKKCYIKRFRKGNTKIYRLNKLKRKPVEKHPEPNKKNSFEEVFESLTQGTQNKIKKFSSLSSLSTNASYITDESKSEVLSTGSKELSFPQQTLRQGVNELCNDKSLIYEREVYEQIPECSKDEVERKIQNILSKVFVDLQNNKMAILKFRRQIMRNCVFKDERLQFKPDNETLMTVIKSTHQRSQSKFKLFLFILEKIQTLLETNTKLTKRELYYQLKYLASNQGITDTALSQISCMLDVGIWSLNIVAQKGLVFGNLKILLSSGEIINCNVPGTLILQDVSDIVEIYSKAYFILVVEKESIFHKLIEDDLPNKLTRPFILVTGKGFPDLNTQLFLKKIWMVMSIPMFILVDADPSGISIMLNYRFGSVNNAHISQHLAVPHAKWLGVYPSEIIHFGIKTQDLSERELKFAQQLLKTPHIKENPKVADELNVLIERKYKASIEGLLKSDNFLSEVYLPAKFYKHDFM